MLSRNFQTLINRRGQPATFTKVAFGAYDPTTGSNTNTTTDYTVKAYFGNFSLTETSSGSITYGDRVVAIPARDTSNVIIPEPDSEDYISGVGDTVIVKSVQKIYNSSTLVCYLCMVRE